MGKEKNQDSPGTEFLLRVMDAMSRILSTRAPSIPCVQGNNLNQLLLKIANKFLIT